MNVDRSLGGINIVQFVLASNTVVTREVVDDSLAKFCDVLRESDGPVKILFDFNGAGLENRSDVRGLSDRLKEKGVQQLILDKLECSVVVASNVVTRMFLRVLFYFYGPKKGNLVVSSRDKGITELCSAVDGKFSR